jgi:hypothetical protein
MIEKLLEEIRNRIRTRRAMRGISISCAALMVSLITAAALAEYVSNKPALLMALRILPILSTAAAAWFWIYRPLKAEIADIQIARFVEERFKLEDKLVTAVEFWQDPRGASAAILARLIEDAKRSASEIEPDKLLDPRPIYLHGALALLSLIATAGLLLSLVGGGAARLYPILGGPISASSMAISVAPGNARVPRGSDQKIRASLAGFDSQSATVFIRKLSEDGWKAFQMEPAREANKFQYVIFNIQDSIAYYVEAGQVRSPEFSLEVADLPLVKRIDLLLDFPAYMRVSPKKIENGTDVAAPRGTAVQVTASLSARARSAHIVFGDGTRIRMNQISEIAFAGQFTIKENGTYWIELESEDGERYNGSNQYEITALEDHPPTVVIDKPGRDMKVTSVQEVFVQARAEDDHGVASIELYYSVNGGPERRIQLQDLRENPNKSLSGTHTFFLEEFGLQPGDFISYYAKARDNSPAAQESTSDIYFLEVRPFNREFRQAQASGNGGDDEGADSLSRRQRDIIAATFRLEREQARYAAREKEENFGAVSLSQERLRSDTEALAERIRRRLGDQLDSQPDFAKIVEHLARAATEMAAATNQLRAFRAKEALQPEQRALQQLLRAESVFRQVQVAQGRGRGRNNQTAQELADLFELQLDKMKNQYETLQREQRAERDQQQDEIARRLQELARRQQQQIEQQMRSGAQGGSGRQQQQIIEELRRAARDLERLSRDRRDPQLQGAAQQLQQAANQLENARAASPSEALARQLDAMGRLERAQRALEAARKGSSSQDLRQLSRRAEEALRQQEDIIRRVDQMAQRSSTEEQRADLAERKRELAEKIKGLERDIERAERNLGPDQDRAANQMRSAAQSMRQNRIADRILQNYQLIENGWYEQAREGERIIRDNIAEVLRNLRAADATGQNRAAPSEALDRIRQLGDNLESMRRQANQQSQQQGQPGQRQSRSNQDSMAQAEQTPVGGGPPRPSRQIERELRERIAEAEEIRRQLEGQPRRELGRIIERMRQIDPNAFSDPSQLAMLKNEVIDPLRRLEMELAQQLQAKFGQTAGSFSESEAPHQYKNMVEDYYRRLSRRQPQP